MSVLVTGGAGYIGSHAVRLFRAAGERVVVYDDLSTGYRESLDEDTELIVGTIQDVEGLARAMRERDVREVVHFAASSLVGESMRDPAKYYRNNVYGTLCLLDAMRLAGASRIVFSSSAATYGNCEVQPILEDAPQHPESVYGRTKLVMEGLLRDYEGAYGIRSMALRYFNVAGAHPDGDIGEAHEPETHIIPILARVLLGRAPSFSIYGTDYPTRDGTCVRDYIHVMDIASAHLLALNALRDGHPSDAYNLGNGGGFTVREVVDRMERVAGRHIPVIEGPRRAGDPPMLVTSSEKLTEALGWKPQYPNLIDIAASAWKWHAAHPDGYAGSAR